MNKLKWRLIGCGDISCKRVAPALRDLETCELVAVNRSRSKLAEEFAREFGVHVHVIEMHSPEVAELRMLRDALRSDPEMVADYVARKRQIIASGVTDSTDYSVEKGSFIQSRVTDSLNS